MRGGKRELVYALVPEPQGYLAHKKLQTPLGPLYDPRHSPTVGSWEEAASVERGTPVWWDVILQHN